MKNFYLIIILLSVVFGISACLIEENNEENVLIEMDESLIETSVLEMIECSAKCKSVSLICPHEVKDVKCFEACDVCGFTDFEGINTPEDCTKINENFAHCNFPVIEAKFCESACQNYNNQCFTKVPNADKALFDEGFDSCMNECKDWDQDKITYMEEAKDCPSMTIVCGL